MNHFDAIKNAIDQHNKAFDVFAKRNNERLDEFGNRIEELETRASSPGRTGSKSHAEKKEAHEHVKRFTAWLREPGDAHTKTELEAFERESKSVTIGTPAAGGYAVPEEIRREVERLEKEFSPVRDLVRVIRVSTSDVKQLVNIRGTASGWAAETTDRSTPTATPQLREIVPTFGELYAYPEASEWSLDDVFFNVADWLAEEVAQEFAIAEGAAVISGDGSNKPTGMHNSAPTAVADFNSPPRAAAVYEFVPSLSTSSPAAAEIVPDSLLTLIYKLNSMYRTRASCIMNSTTAAEIRKLKDGNGMYLWAPGLAAGQPDRLLGYPVSIWEQMPDVGTNALPVGFGDFRRAYVLADRTDLRITVDPYTKPGYTRFYVRRREGGARAQQQRGEILEVHDRVMHRRLVTCGLSCLSTANGCGLLEECRALYLAKTPESTRRDYSNSRGAAGTTVGCCRPRFLPSPGLGHVSGAATPVGAP